MENILQVIHRRAGTEPVRFGLVLGSGLGHLADAIDGVVIPYEDLPGFPHVGVSGHKAALHIGDFEGVRVAVFGGRSHYYEAGDATAMRLPLEVLKALGAEAYIATNSAGSMRTDMLPGSLMLLSDHINFSGRNPLIGESTIERFVNMADAYNETLSDSFKAAAKAEEIKIYQGVYAWYSGPSFETPAEIRALKILGGDAVGMSTVPEVILARFLGLNVLAISSITNMAAGMSDEVLSHEHTKKMAPLGGQKLEQILRRFLRDL